MILNNISPILIIRITLFFDKLKLNLPCVWVDDLVFSQQDNIIVFAINRRIADIYNNNKQVRQAFDAMMTTISNIYDVDLLRWKISDTVIPGTDNSYLFLTYKN
jgi:hypothetical protein